MSWLDKIFGKRRVKDKTANTRNSPPDIPSFTSVENIQEFLKAMQTGPCHIQIPVSDIPDYYDAVVQNLRDQGYSDQILTNLVQSEFRGICPSCCAWLDSTLLFQPSVIREIGREKMIRSGHGSISRLLDGNCPHFECESRQIRLIWKGHPETKALVEAVVHLAIVNHENEPVNRFIRQDVLSYVADAIWVQRNKKSSQHIYTGQKSRNGDIWVWVSVMFGLPNEENSKARLFPAGYGEFLNGLLSDSNYNSGSIAVMHWIHGFEQTKQATFFSFVDNRNNLGQKGWMLLPTDLLNESEIKRLGH